MKNKTFFGLSIIVKKKEFSTNFEFRYIHTRLESVEEDVVGSIIFSLNGRIFNRLTGVLGLAEFPFKT